MLSAAVASLLLASATGAELRTAPGKKIFGQYIVRMHKSETAEDMKHHISLMREELHEDMEVMHVYNHLQNGLGYSTKLTEKALEKLMKVEGVSFIEEDSVVDINDCQKESNPDWGLARVNHRNYTATTTYTYDYTTGSAGTNIVRTPVIFSSQPSL